MRSIHIADNSSRDAYVRFVSVRANKPPQKGVNGRPVVMRRLLMATEINTQTFLAEQYGDALGQSLIDGDPELDLEMIGRPVERTSCVYLDGSRNILRMAPDVVEVILDPSGQEKERRAPEDRFANVSEEIPVRFTRTRIKRAEAVRRFAFSRTLQLWHTDGLSYEFLHGLAAELDSADEMVLLAAGERGRDPIVLQLNGLPWRAFLEGRVNESGYCLLLRLSNLELKAPPAKP